ncbi:hypothetical protein N7495_003024 [Penicillium taxi]|uniref:uncharacterized protein n=1 Tax=Penicillium taxi TaxID=168475 RepID=UPI002545ABA1|nr:uncharacterized protein N7495_003024 [Penicillium taxi]KAJ5902496.1 hypothetical protein N7495_003024 [Penicillium taxi]
MPFEQITDLITELPFPESMQTILADVFCIIEEIQEYILELMQNSNPYDIFLTKVPMPVPIHGSKHCHRDVKATLPILDIGTGRSLDHE